MGFLRNANVFTTIDINEGYWYITVAEQDIPRMALVCHSGVFEFLEE